MTRLFRQRAAADRYAEHQEEIDRSPVTIWTVDIGLWREADPSW